jgi:V8-like Glu-specific endopeptidase
MGKLSKQDIPELADKLNSTLSFDDLELFTQASTGDRLYDVYVSKDKPKVPMIAQLLNTLEELGKTSAFVSYVYARRQGRPDVQAEIVKYFPEAAAAPPQRKIELSAQTAGVPQQDAPTNALAPGLQRNVRPYLNKLDIRVWSTRLAQIERRVCRVELGGEALGTGFLVGPDTVLTNWHVYEVAKNAGKPDALGFRFDYEVLPGGNVQPGQLIKMQAGGCIDSSPYSAAEATATPDNPLPGATELDYALLRLAVRAGEQQVDGQPRGWIPLPNAVLPLPANVPILIVQHPEGSPMKLAMDTQSVIGLNGNGTRINYRTNTDPGSSGSPAFTMDWDLVALHHSGDPKYLNPTYNQGVPIELIRQRIDANGFGDALGA